LEDALDKWIVHFKLGKEDILQKSCYM
jgi:hypothetical protein